MFSKALFKQSCKANGLMWLIITVAVCFMLSCVMLISGSGNIGEVKDSIEDTIITAEIDSVIQQKAVTYYANATDGLAYFDNSYVEHFKEDSVDLADYSLRYKAWFVTMPKQEDYSTTDDYNSAYKEWQEKMPEMITLADKLYAKSVSEWANLKPKQESFSDTNTYLQATQAWMGKMPTANDVTPTSAYYNALIDLQKLALNKIGITENIDSYFDENMTIKEDLLTKEQKEGLGCFLIAINPNDKFNQDYFTKYNKTAPVAYDVESLVIAIKNNNADTYIKSSERITYRNNRAAYTESSYLAANFLLEESVNELLQQLSEYGVDKAKYDSFNYTYESISYSSNTTIASYQGRYDYEISIIDEKLANGEIQTNEQYDNEKNKIKKELLDSLSGSLLSSLPDEVSDALEEIGKADLYSLIVGSIFFKVAGLLLPIIYMIMASTNLISGQVDSGSMAYVLCTSTKRKEVVFTQAVYLIGSLFLMFLCTCITSIICLNIVNIDGTELNVGKLVLINLGAFLVLFAMSGINFLTTCWFDRSKRSMAIGGGLSIFFLVATILGLFGSKVIPSVVRLDALNYFNYVSIITFFDVISILDGTNAFLWKFAILLAIGIIGYIIGSRKFIKKDLPL